jgi:hypothetical protein
LTAAFGIALILSGCSDPRFKQKQNRRDARITRHLTEYAAHDAAGVERMRQTVELDKELSRQRAEHLTRTCGLVRALHERDVRRWKEEEPLRKARLEALSRGKPDEIDDTYAKMVY